MKQIYIILTYTGTVLSRIIKVYTKDEFSHVSLALDPELEEMYSFGRLNPYNPFVGGFVHEGINRGTFKRFKKTRAKVIELNVNDSQYARLKKAIEKIQNEKEHYKFNTLGLFATGFNIKIRAEKSFYCAEFVKHIIEQSTIEMDLPELIRPENFKYLCGGKEVYSGLLQNYKYALEDLYVPKASVF